MNPDRSEQLANLVLGAAAIGVAVLVVRTPALRRLAWGLARTLLTTTLPALMVREVGQAWADSARDTPRPS